MTTVNYADAFRDKVVNLLSFLEDRFPTDPSVKTVKAALATTDMLVGTSGSRYMMRTFMDTAVEYLIEIDDRNADFFLKLSQANPTFAGMNIPDKWATLSRLDRERVWDYCDDLLSLGSKGLGLRLMN